MAEFVLSQAKPAVLRLPCHARLRGRAPRNGGARQWPNRSRYQWGLAFGSSSRLSSSRRKGVDEASRKPEGEQTTAPVRGMTGGTTSAMGQVSCVMSIPGAGAQIETPFVAQPNRDDDSWRPRATFPLQDTFASRHRETPKRWNLTVLAQKEKIWVVSL